MKYLEIDGYHLNLDDLYQSETTITLDDSARATCLLTRAQVEKWLVKDAPVIYGINTGLGNLKDSALSTHEHKKWNKTIPYPHAVGMGAPIPAEITRTALLIRANVLSRSYSGVRPQLIDRMLAMYNANISPVVYEIGSTGLSDLGPLAQNAMAIAGFAEADVYYNDIIMSAQDAFKLAGLDEIFEFECKEVLSLMNGSTMTQAISIYAFKKFEIVLATYTKDSQSDDIIINAINQTSAYIRSTLNFENNITCDNPLLFKVEESYEAVMGCNCSNTQVGYVMDLMTMLIGDLACITLKANFNEKNNSLYQLIMQLQIPASADSIATKANQEDHVEFSYGAARKALKAVEYLIKM